MAEPSAIATERLAKRYGPGLTAVDELSITVRRGEIYGLVGPNGAGKTTLMRMLVGPVRPSAGRATVLGRHAGAAEANARVGAMIEGPTFYPHLSGRDNLRVIALYAGAPKAWVDHLLEMVGLSARAGDSFGTYSMGMRQRVGIAAALIKDPDLLILDEPTTGLDPEGIAEMRSFLRELGSGERTVMLSSHLMAEVEQICDRIGVIRKGQLVAEGTVDELRGEPTLLVEAHPLDRARELIGELPFVSHIDGNERELVLSVPLDRARDINRLLVCNSIDVDRLSPQTGTVEDRLLGLLSEEGSTHHEQDSR